jgi:hypothetical protein
MKETSIVHSDPNILGGTPVTLEQAKAHLIADASAA